MAFVPFTKEDQPTMAAFNEKFQQAIEQAIADGVKIEVGSYVGTGMTTTLGSPIELTFSFAPKALIVKDSRATATGMSNYMMIAAHTDRIAQTISYAGSDPNYYAVYITFSDNIISWYATNSSKTGAGGSLNTSGRTYNYIAIG